MKTITSVRVLGTVALVAMASVGHANINDPAVQAALHAVYNQTDGPNWVNNTNWSGDANITIGCDAYGLICDDSNNVTGFELANNNLTGSIPAELGELSKLESLKLSSNNLSGGIPPALGKLTNLTSLSLAANPLGGTIPGELANLGNLVLLELMGDELTGTLPTWLGSLTSLITVRLNNNQLTGPIPESIGNLTQLFQLWLQGNQLSGAIPSSIGDLANVHFLLLQNNQLSGGLPLELAKLESLAVLALFNNKLSGVIPPDLFDGSVYSGLQNFVSLALDNNEFEGPIPASLGNMKTLQSLNLAHNRLSGSIPAELGQLTQLLVLSLAGNKLSGSIPAELIDLTALFDTQSDLEWNALHSDDATLNTFIDQKSNLTYSSYLDTQVLVPENLKATGVTHNSVDLVWSVASIHSYVGGGYKLYQTTSQDGPYEEVKNITSSATSAAIYGLQGDTTYWFAIRAYTDPFNKNKNTVLSDLSQAVVITTYPGPVMDKPQGSVEEDSGGGALDMGMLFTLFIFLARISHQDRGSRRTTTSFVP